MANGDNGSHGAIDSAIQSIDRTAGEVSFAVDLGTGIVTVSIRRPLDIAPTIGTVSVLDFLDNAATIQLEMSKLQRAAMERIRRSRPM